MSANPGKDLTGMRLVKSSLEPTTMDLGIERTPTDLFFVCSGCEAPTIAANEWQLAIAGDAVAAPVTIDYTTLRALPHRRVESWLECAGNGRAMFELAGGYPRPTAAEDTAWTLGAMGMASWVGVSLRDVFELAGVTDAAAWIGVEGADDDHDEGEAGAMCLPIDKALDADTILAFSMNDADLLPAHGYPVRLLVPGWVGAYSIKWLRRLEVSTTWVSSWRADVYYRRRLADGTDLGPATVHPIKSCLALKWPAELASGSQIIRGYARCGHSPVERVEISIDSGHWFDAGLIGGRGGWDWQPFEFEWAPTPGGHEIRSRAWAVDGATQPDTIDYHPNTILWNAVTAHPIRVSD